MRTKVQTSIKQTNSGGVRKEEKVNLNSGIIESMKGYFTNLSYGFQGLKLTSYFSGNGEGRLNESNKVYILGSQLSAKQSQKAHQDIIWFTYRNNINISQKIHSDVGWGCLIRVAQMEMAQSLKRFFQLHQNKVQKNYIITPFLEDRRAQFKYNIQRFVERGSKMWKLQVGQWYSMTQVATILESLHQDNPLKGSQNLKIRVYNQIINIKELLQIFDLPLCRCKERKISCFICQHSKKKDFKQSYFQKKVFSKSTHQNGSNLFKKHTLLIITTKLGYHNIDKNNFKILLKLMELPIFNGCLGGMPEKARFLTGHNGDRISYLDPHYVESAVNQMDLHQKKQIFQCKQIRYMTRQQLAPQMALCFYLSHPSDLELLIDTINNLQCQSKGFDFIRYDWETNWNGSNEYEVLTQAIKQPKLSQKFQDLQEGLETDYNQNMESSFLMD